MFQTSQWHLLHPQFTQILIESVLKCSEFLYWLPIALVFFSFSQLCYDMVRILQKKLTSEPCVAYKTDVHNPYSVAIIGEILSAVWPLNGLSDV